MWEFVTGLALGLALPFAGPWLLARWNETAWPWLRSRLPTWLGGAA